MAQAQAPPLRPTDFLPSRFSGASVDRDTCTAHFLSFSDYLDAHGLQNPGDQQALNHVVGVFKRSLCGTARLWIEGKAFNTLQQLKDSFLGRFSPRQSNFARAKEFELITYESGDSAEIHFSKIRRIAERAGYGNVQIRDKFLSTLPNKCRSAVVMAVPEDAGMPELIDRAQRFLDLQSEEGSGTKEVSFAVHDSSLELNALKEQINQIQNDIVQSRQSRPERRHSPFLRPRHQRSHSNSRHGSRSGSGSRNSFGNANRNGTNWQQTSTSSRIICDYCHKNGHKWRSCRKLEKDMRERRSSMSPRRHSGSQDFHPGK